MLASGSRAEVIPDSALFPIYVCPRASARGTSCFSRFISATFSRRARGSPCNLCIETSPAATPRLVASRSRPRSRPSVSSQSRKDDINYDRQVSRDDESRFQRAVRCASKSWRCLSRQQLTTRVYRRTAFVVQPAEKTRDSSPGFALENALFRVSFPRVFSVRRFYLTTNAK